MKILASYLITGSILFTGFCTSFAHAAGMETLDNPVFIAQVNQESIDSTNEECCKDHELNEETSLFSVAKKETKLRNLLTKVNLIKFDVHPQKQAFQKYFSFIPNAPPLVGTVVKIE